MEFNKPFGLPTVLGTVSSATKDENHRILSLQVRELPPRPPVVGKLVIREVSPWNDVGSHIDSSQ
jgi:hypothetical protein